MKEWSTINLQLLPQDRCNKILNKALNILDGLPTHHLDIINPTLWPAMPNDFIPLLLIKIYFETNLIPDSQNIIEYFEIAKKNILLIASKITTKNNNENQAQNTLDSLDLSILELLDDPQIIFITEVLNNFHKIIKSTTVELWEYTKNHKN
jgi:hypothetical protein